MTFFFTFPKCIHTFMTFAEGGNSQSRDTDSRRIVPGVRPATYAFLEDARGTEAYQRLDPQRRRLIDAYFTSPSSIRALAHNNGVEKEQLRKLLQEAHPAEEVIFLKNNQRGLMR